jgi:hypothetical protein
MGCRAHRQKQPQRIYRAALQVSYLYRVDKQARAQRGWVEGETAGRAGTLRSYLHHRGCAVHKPHARQPLLLELLLAQRDSHGPPLLAPRTEITAVAGYEQTNNKDERAQK